MSKYTKYKLYQKYETRGSQEAIPCYPNVFSIDGDRTMPLVIVEENSRDCGYTGETQPIYRWYTLPIDTYYYCDACQDAQYKWVNLPISQDWECVGTTKYYKQKKQVSVDGGSTWTDVTPPQYQRGALYEESSQSCGYRTRSTSGTPYCTGYNKYVDVYSQYSTDGGNTWQTTATTKTLVEAHSSDCSGGGDYENQYFTAIPHSRTAFEFRQNRNAGDGYPIQYSLDEGVTWQTVPNNTKYPFVEAGQKIMWKAHARPYNPTIQGEDPEGCGYFYSTNRLGQNQPPFRIFAGEDYTVEGNIMSLVYGDDFRGKKDLSEIGDHAFMELFQAKGYRYADNLILPATGLTTSCYEKMFAHSFGNNIILPPKVLPAKNLAPYCYFDMFRYNSEMTTVPTLSATSLATGCFERMFAGCRGITSVSSNYLPFTSLAYECYAGMFAGTSITVAPNLPATSMTEWCYHSMFRNCTGLTTPPQLPSTSLANHCYEEMFSGCTSLTTAPDLPASTLYLECYRSMFKDCTSLTRIKCLARNFATDSTTDWVDNVGLYGTFVKSSVMNSWAIDSTSGIPTTWTVQSVGTTRDVSGDTYCNNANQYVQVQTQLSYDNGQTWETVSTRTVLVEANSYTCGYRTRTTSGTPYCTGYDKYVDVTIEESRDTGQTWTTVSTTPTMIEHNSYDCGYVGYRWTRTNSTLCINTAHTEVDYVQTPSVSPYAGIELLNIPSSTNTPMYYEIDFSIETISEGEARPLAQKSDNETVGYQMGFCLADNEWLTKPYFDYGGGRIETTYQDIGGIGNRLKVGVGVYSGDSQVEIRRLDTNTRLVSSAATPTNVLIPVICNATYNTNTSGDTYASANQIRYYGIKVYDNNVLVGNYIPVIRNSDNLVTLFDTITNRYCNIIGSGQLTASPNV